MSKNERKRTMVYSNVNKNAKRKADTESASKNNEIIAEKRKHYKISGNERIIHDDIIGDIVTGDNVSDLMFKDMRVLLKIILGEPAREFKAYNTYNCPFHDDKKPSARVYTKNFLCASENLHLNYFEFIRKYYKLNSDDEVKEKMADLKKLVMKEID